MEPDPELEPESLAGAGAGEEEGAGSGDGDGEGGGGGVDEVVGFGAGGGEKLELVDEDEGGGTEALNPWVEIREVVEELEAIEDVDVVEGVLEDEDVVEVGAVMMPVDTRLELASVDGPASTPPTPPSPPEPEPVAEPESPSDIFGSTTEPQGSLEKGCPGHPQVLRHLEIQASGAVRARIPVGVASPPGTRAAAARKVVRMKRVISAKLERVRW